LRRFEEGELEALSANGDGLPGGPPTTKPEGSTAPSGPVIVSGVRPVLLDDCELRRSFGGGMGEGEDMMAERSTLMSGSCREEVGERVVGRPAVR
jgi:hypothetical protein